MVYYYTSKNVKILRNIIIDYGASNEISPCEYMKMYLEKCPETMEDNKISWIVETFLSIQKHGLFLKEMVSYVTKEISEEDQDYFLIAFHAVTFQITPNNMPLFYKCLFNLSKSLLNTFTSFLCNNEILAFISQFASCYYDTNYVAEKIINPLFLWQPYISEMEHSYAQYVKKVERQSIKQPTKPISPNVLHRRSKKPYSVINVVPTAPPNSLPDKGKCMLTKSVIDQRLKQIYNNNKQKSLQLLQTVKANNFHHAQPRKESNKKVKNIVKEENINNDDIIPKIKRKSKLTYPIPAVKETSTTVKRINKRIEMTEKQEIQWLQDLVGDCRNTMRIEELEYYDRQERERERLLDIERKHLLGQISYEEAVIAKKKLHDENKKKYKEFLKEKLVWEEEIEKWKINEIEKNRKQVEKLSLQELSMLHARNNLLIKKKAVADEMKKESEQIISKVIKDKQKELEKKIKMIKEIKILAKIAKKIKIPKIVDLTESSGVGLLCEMSMAELEERLNIIKIGLKEELEEKKRNIKEEKMAAKRDLEETKKCINNFMNERAEMKKQNKKESGSVDISSCKEINELKKILEEKRKLRVNLTT